MLPYFSDAYGNPSSLHSSGRRAAQAISEARAAAATAINCLPEEVIFTGSGTESDNLALWGVAHAYRSLGDHIIISAVEHKAVLSSARRLEKEGFRVTVLPVDQYGRVSVEKVIAAITNKTILISIMYANNEVGTVEPIIEIMRAVRVHRGARGLPLVHTDACQAVGALSVDTHVLGVDLMTLNSSKIYGPKGVGLLFKRKGVALEALIVGGEQEMNIRAGTESVPLIVGFSKALSKAVASAPAESLRLSNLRDYAIERLLLELPHAVLNGHPEERLPNNIHLSIPDVEGESIVLMLDTHGIEASTGSACSAFDLKPSHVLLALGQTAELAHGSVRFSLGKYTTRDDIDELVEILPSIVRKLQAISALTVHL